MKFLSKLFKNNKGPLPKTRLEKRDRDPAQYEVEKQRAKSAAVKDRLSLAKNPNTHLEILFYLAEDKDIKVRRAVAANPSTPLHVSEILAKDNDVDVKLALITRLSDLLPDLSQDQYAHLYAFAAAAMGILALDEVLKVRLALSTALRDELYAPPEVIKQLAKDLERQVSEPILKLCTIIPDDVLIEIIQQHPSPWAAEAIAGRREVSIEVSTVLIEKGDTKVGQALILNKTAKISDETLDNILSLALDKPEWHRPLALQSHLPARVIQQIVMFVDTSIHKLIFERADMDDETRNDLLDTISRRVNFLIDSEGNKITVSEKIKILIDRHELNDDAIKDALALREYDFVYDTLAYKSKLHVKIVKKMINTGSPKSVVSIVWKAGFTMRTALEVQKALAQIQPRELIYPKNGNEYPLSEKDMQWQVDFFSD